MDKIVWMQCRMILSCYAMRNGVRARISIMKYMKILGEPKSKSLRVLNGEIEI